MKVQFASNLSIVNELMWYDGPVLSHAIDADTQQDYIIVWIDVSEENHLWLTVEISKSDLSAYFNNEITLLQVQEKSNKMYYCEGQFIDENHKAKGVLQSFDKMPEAWKALAGSFLK